MNARVYPILANVKYNRGRITGPIAHLLVAPLAKSFIVSYPRSGSTWLRTMLTNIIVPSANSDPRVFNKVIPGTTLTRIGSAYCRSASHILSTHSIYNRLIHRAVYVLRDGRDSVLSFYRYTTIRDGNNVDFSNWFKYYKKGFFGPRWDEHVESWLKNGKKHLGSDMMLVRYEDLRSNTAEILHTICEFLEIKHGQEDICRAIELSSIERMKKWEKRLVGNVDDKNASFYRGLGKAPEWITLLNKRQREEFLVLSEHAMRLGGYL